MEDIKPQRSIVEESGGVFTKYLKRVVGTKSVSYFIKYEILNTLFCNCPGALGLFIRHIFYPSLLGYSGGKLQFGRGITIRGGLSVSLGRGTILDDYTVLDAKSEYNPGIIIGEKCLISRNTKISTGYTGYIKTGNNAIIGENCIIHGPGGIEIGHNVLISDGVLLNAGLHVYSDPDKNILSQGITTKGIKIGDDTWIGAGAIIKDGVNIGRGCVIEAGSVVSSSFPEYSVISGNPAVAVGKRK